MVCPSLSPLRLRSKLGLDRKTGLAQGWCRIVCLNSIPCQLLKCQDRATGSQRTLNGDPGAPPSRLHGLIVPSWYDCLRHHR